jgi:hypothetical protein
MTSQLAVPFSQIPAIPVSWDMEGWLPKRHVTLAAAPGKTSKGILSFDFAARKTTGRNMPIEPLTTTHPVCSVVVVAPEDDANEALAFRGLAAGVDPELLFNLTLLSNGDPFLLPYNWPDLENVIKQISAPASAGGFGKPPVGLVILDPLLAMVDKPITTDGAARRIIAPLEALAKKYDYACMLTQHTVKSGKIASASGLVNACRMVWRLEKVGPKDGPERELSVEASNMAASGGRLRYRLVGDGDMASVEWDAEKPADAVSSLGYITIPPGAVYTLGRRTRVGTGAPDDEVMGAQYPSAAVARQAAQKDSGPALLHWKPAAYPAVATAVTTPQSGTSVSYVVSMAA